MFRAHLLGKVKDTLKENKTYQAVIPGCCTSVLQPLDVCLNKPFKVNMRQRWNQWMVNAEKQITKAGNIWRPGLKTVCQWVIDAWNNIPTDMVVKSFLKCGISNSMDGTEDDELYNDFVSLRDWEGGSSVVEHSVMTVTTKICTTKKLHPRNLINYLEKAMMRNSLDFSSVTV